MNYHGRKKTKQTHKSNKRGTEREEEREREIEQDAVRVAAAAVVACVCNTFRGEFGKLAHIANWQTAWRGKQTERDGGRGITKVLLTSVKLPHLIIE